MNRESDSETIRPRSKNLTTGPSPRPRQAGGDRGGAMVAPCRTGRARDGDFRAGTKGGRAVDEAHVEFRFAARRLDQAGGGDARLGQGVDSSGYKGHSTVGAHIYREGHRGPTCWTTLIGRLSGAYAYHGAS